MATIMLRVPVMTEESQIYKQNVPANFIITAEQIAIDGTDLIQVNLDGQTVIPSQVSINELGKQLLKAAGDGNVEEVKTLMAKGAAFTADWLGTTPLHLAAQNNHLEICEILLRAGISKDAKTKVDRTPLHMAVYEGHMEIVEALLAVGADFDIKDMLLMTPLHWAAQNCHAEIAVLLIKYGAATELVNKFNLTPADIAQQMGRIDIAELIMSAAHDPLLASQHLALQLAHECNSDSNMSCEGRSDSQNANSDELCTPVETVLVEDDDENSQSAQILNTDNNTENSCSVSPRYSPDFHQASLAESLKILQQHAITMLPSEEHNILSSAVESGHAVVLTEVGKEVLNSLKAAEASDLPKMQFREPVQGESKKYVTISPEEFFALTGSNAANQLSVTRHANNGAIKQSVRRGVMKKNKVKLIQQSNHIAKVAKSERPTDMETVMKQLIEARKLIEEYKVKLKKKEAEAEKYKLQLRMMMEGK